MTQACRSAGWSAAVLIACLDLLLASGPASAAESMARADIPAPEQVAVSGIINDAAGPNFRLRYGAGEISVVLQAWERFREAGAPPVMGIGDRVTVTGAADEAFYSARTLDAQSVYVDDRDTFYTTSWSRHGKAPWEVTAMAIPPLYGGRPISITLAGRVVDVSKQMFSLEVGASPVQIDTREMIGSPLDAIGGPAIEIGDWVQVGGTLEDAFFRDRRLEALRVTRIVGAETDAS